METVNHLEKLRQARDDIEQELLHHLQVLTSVYDLRGVSVGVETTEGEDGTVEVVGVRVNISV